MKRVVSRFFRGSRHPPTGERRRIKVLFVCTGNICRSPTAEGVFSRLVVEKGWAASIDVDSAGTHARRRTGDPPDPRAIAAALRRGLDISGLRARCLDPRDFVEFDYLLAMDRFNLEVLRKMCAREHGHKIELFMSYAPEWNTLEVPDPFGGSENLFDHVLDRIEAAAQGLAMTLAADHAWLSRTR